MGHGRPDYESETYFNRKELTCESCDETYEELTEDADSIESSGACLNCAFEKMLQNKTERPKLKKAMKAVLKKKATPVASTNPLKERTCTMATATEKAPAEKIVKKSYLTNGEKLVEVPTDFNPSRHLSLTTEDFTEEAMYYEWRAYRAQLTVDKFMEKAKDCREFGSPEKRKAKRSLESMAKKMAEMEAKLSEQIGADEVAALMEAIKASS